MAVAMRQQHESQHAGIGHLQDHARRGAGELAEPGMVVDDDLLGRLGGLGRVAAAACSTCMKASDLRRPSSFRCKVSVRYGPCAAQSAIDGIRSSVLATGVRMSASTIASAVGIRKLRATKPTAAMAQTARWRAAGGSRNCPARGRPERGRRARDTMKRTVRANVPRVDDLATKRFCLTDDET